LEKKFLVAVVAIALIPFLTGGYYYFSHDPAPNAVSQSVLGVNLANVTRSEALSQIGSEVVWAEQNNVSIN
jgi:hypothetical protein